MKQSDNRPISWCLHIDADVQSTQDEPSGIAIVLTGHGIRLPHQQLPGHLS